MKTKFTSSSARIIVALFVFAIIIGFVFTSNQGGGFFTAEENVAEINSTPITYREYQTVLAQTAQRYSQLFGGKELTQQQLKQFGVHRTTMQNLIEKKVIFNLSENLGFSSSTKEIKDFIKNIYFKDGFNVEQYKAVLSANRWTPQKFELMVREDILVKKVEEILLTRPISKGFARELAEIKSNIVSVDAVRVEKNKLRDHVKVAASEVSAYIKDPKNSGILKMMYDGKKAQYNKPEEIQAFHILYKDSSSKSLNKLKALRKTLSAKNFKKVANKETQDPSGKGKGGSLGWFSKGRMVPEFEKVAFGLKKGQISAPVKTSFGYHLIYVEGKKKAKTKTLEQAKPELAEESLRKKKSDDLNKLMKTVSRKLSSALKTSSAKAKSLSKSYGLELLSKKDVNPFDAKVDRFNLEDEQIKKLFSSKANEVVIFDGPSYNWVIKVNKKSKAKDLDNLMKQEHTAFGSQVSRKFRSELISKLTKDSNVSCVAQFQDVAACKK